MTFEAGQIRGGMPKETLAVVERVRQRRQRNCLPSVVSLFAGAGGLDLGFKQAGFEIRVAIDFSAAAIRSHKHNFPGTDAHCADLSRLKARGVLALVKKALRPGSTIGVIGGPPCQGFSRANTRSQADDPRNELPALYVSIIAALQTTYTVEFMVFENVLGIRDKKHAARYAKLKKALSKLQFDIAEQELCSLDFGVAQNRRRILLSGVRAQQGYGKVSPRKHKGAETVREAIGHIDQPPIFFAKKLEASTFPLHPNHWTMKPKSPRFLKPEESTGDGRSFKRLRWDEPSPTVAYGHREIHVHPTGTRRVSVYEAMLLQGFPRSFELKGNLSEQVEQVSNAVPPPVGKSVASAIKRALSRARKRPRRR